MGVSEKKYIEKRLLKMFLTEDEVGIDNIRAISSTMLVFAVGWALCGRPQPEHKLVMPLRSLSPLSV